MIVYTIEFTASQPAGCQFIQPFAYDSFAQHQTGFYASVQSFTFSSINLLRLFLTVANTAPEVGKIGTDGHHIQDVAIRKLYCISSTSGQMK